MKQISKWSLGAITVGAVLACNGVARSQTTPNTPGTPGLRQHASDNVSGGSIRARAPGNMVGAGVVRTQAAADFARAGIEIVETTRPMSPRAGFLVEAIEIAFQQFNRSLLLLANILRQRAGLPPLIPSVTTPTTPDPVAEEVPIVVEEELPQSKSTRFRSGL